MVGPLGSDESHALPHAGPNDDALSVLTVHFPSFSYGSVPLEVAHLAALDWVLSEIVTMPFRPPVGVVTFRK